MKLIATGLLLGFGAISVKAQAALYGQCGGTGWSGATTCVSGATCTVINPYYSQCLPGAASSSAPTSSPRPTSSSSAPTSTGTPPSTSGGYVQQPSGSASFTMYTGCNQPACGIAASGYTAAINQLAFGSAPGLGPGDACGRCFALTASADPYSPGFTGPFKSIIVKVTDMCPVAGNQEWCGQSKSNPTNQHGTNFHFDICEDTGGAAVFFPSGHGALTGSFTEVSCSQWSGSDGSSLWNGACISGEKAANWPSGVGCGNQGL
ncbi:hypothetical protein CVT26_014418 [Gymnopilus dilepis]|uniref:CBM1 domain-containing protein n=1 Tax=Gymnopilus dilepis TaxID=231916 RepID=A0A409Y7U0_9AGAR|nr:hypothetical protein CVT26_014418 [Gymnopilus dilepis]